LGYLVSFLTGDLEYFDTLLLQSTVEPPTHNASLVGGRNVFELPGLVLDAWVALGVMQHGIENSNKPVKLIQRHYERFVAVMSLNPPVKAWASWNVVSMTLEFDKLRTLNDDTARLFSGGSAHSLDPLLC